MTRRASSQGALVALAVLASGVPLVVALLARRHPAWVPDLDLALTELRVRDVGGRHSPLVGLPGRLGEPGRQGSHPGPLSFYLLAPTYRLLGSSAFALQAATVVVHVAGVVATVALVARQAGARWALTVGVALAVLVTALGPGLFTEPWNPHLPLLWWPAFLAAAWLALCGDGGSLPVLVLAGAICAQTHVSHLGAVGVITVAAAAVCLRWPAGPRTARWAVGAGALALVLWAPPVLDQARHDPGNATILREHLLDPPEAEVGWSQGTRLALARLDLVHLARGVVDPGILARPVAEGASAGRGGLLLVALAAAAGLAVRRGARDVRAVTGLAVAASVLAVVSTSQISGLPWGYLMLWGWSVALLAAVAIAAVAAARSGPAEADGVARRDHRLAIGRGGMTVVGAGLVVLATATGLRAGVAAAPAGPTNPVVSRTVLALVPDVVEHLAPGRRYLVTWDDSVHLGGHGYGMFDELERRGVHVVVPPGLATQFGAHRTGRTEDVDGQVVVATGDAIERWTVQPGATLLARVDLRSAAERAMARSTRRALIAALGADGRTDLVRAVDDNVFLVAVDPRVDERTRDLALRLDALGAPAAVLLVPVA